MSVLILVLATAGQWSNEGWADNPAPTVKRSSWAADPFERKVLPASLKDDSKPEPAKEPSTSRPIEPQCSCEQRSAWCPCKQGVRGNGVEAGPPAERPSVHFSPDGGCEAEIVERIGDAEHDVRVFAYAFTSAPIADALIQAKGRGVNVGVIMDHVQARGNGSQMGRLVSAGVSTLVDSRHPIMHNKVVVVDGETVLTGSFNFSVQAGRNAENLLTLPDSSLARQYLDNWDLHAAHSTGARPVAELVPGVIEPDRPATPPTLYRLADRTNKVWSSPDPAWLQTYVNQVNASLTPTAYAAPTYAQPLFQGFSGGSACAGGSCGQAQSFGFFGGLR